MKDIFLLHYSKYPKMQIQDFLKLLYQSCFGPMHLHSNPDLQTIHKYLTSELETVKDEGKFQEEIGNGYSRIYLDAILSNRMSLTDLEEGFYESMNQTIDMSKARNDFRTGVIDLIELIEEKKIDLDLNQSVQLTSEYMEKGIRPIHHSAIYKEEYDPHYRVVSDKLIKP